jgi:hypothetical protein
VAKHNNIADEALRDQWKQLILQPLSMLKANSLQSPLILVVDALDECAGDNDVRIILQSLAEATTLETVQLRIFLTSRPEIPIRHGFDNIPGVEHQDFVLHNISQSIADHDISVFLEYHLGMIRRGCYLPVDWPGKQTIEHLLQSACGLFIWAATACRFIEEGRRFAPKRLARILQRDTASATPEEKLNQIYRVILANSIREEYEQEEKEDLYKTLKSILGAIAILYSSLSAVSLASLLHIPENNIA